MLLARYWWKSTTPRSQSCTERKQDSVMNTFYERNTAR
jgi:hypothetical protein